MDSLNATAIETGCLFGAVADTPTLTDAQYQALYTQHCGVITTDAALISFNTHYGASALNSSFAATTVLNPLQRDQRRTCGLICPMAARLRAPRRITTTTLCATRRANHACARSSRRSENIPVLGTPKSALQTPPSHPSTRGVGHRRERWDGMRWTRQGRARDVIAGRISRERLLRADERRCFPGFAKTSVGVHYPPKHLVKLARGRQKRVVPAPVAGVKSAEVLLTQPGSARPLIRR